MKQSWKWAAVAAVAGSLALAQKPKSNKERDAIIAVQNALTPDARMEAIENMLTNFADTEYKAILLETAIDMALQKNDPVQTTIYAERLLEADPKNLNAISTLATVTGNGIRENDLDKEDKLKRVDELTGQCLKIGPEATNPNKLRTDEVWEQTRATYLAGCHEAVAATAILRKKPDVAVSEYQASLAARKDPATMVRLGQVLSVTKRYDEAIAMFEQAQNFPDVHPTIKQVASNERVKTIMARQKAKSQADVSIPQKQ